MSNIYKLCHTVDKENTTLFVFYGKKQSIIDSGIVLNELFKREPENILFEGIFSEVELKDILDKNINVEFVAEYIHIDDTIETIKKKLMKNVSNTVSFGEIYFYIKKFEKLKSETIYQTITQNESLELTRGRLTQFLLNIDGITPIIAVKDIYDYEDIKSLDLDNKTFLVSKSIGQKFVSIETTYPYTVNPYNATEYDPFLEKNADNITTTTNKNLLMDTKNINNNTIFFCTASEVLKHAMALKLSQESTVKIYFPYLREKDINNLQQLDTKKEILNIESEKMLNTNFDKNEENVNLFYNVYNERKNKEASLFKSVGIKELEITIHPEQSFNLPLDIVFKLIHATEKVPFIKYNPEKRQEKIFRLYANKLATNGNKIPYMNKANINKLIKQIGRNKSVAVYIEDVIEGEVIKIICEFENNGDITIKSTFSNGMTIDQIDKIFIAKVNPVINVIKDYISQNGYNMNNFKSLNDAYVEVSNLAYVMNIQITKSIQLKKIIGCVSSIFSVIEDDLAKGIVMRYKRVANYNEMTSQEAFIIDNLNANNSEYDIIEGLSKNFSISMDVARAKFADFATSLQVVQNAFQNKKIKIKNSPGFLVTMVKEQFDNTAVTISVSGINDIFYLKVIPNYIDSLMRISQNPTSTNVSTKVIDSQCSGKKIQDEPQINDIVAQAEQPYSENKQMRIVAQELVFEEEAGEGAGDNMLDFLLGFANGSDEEDEDENENDSAGIEVGGALPGEAEAGPSASESEAPAASASDLLKKDITGMSLTHPNVFSTKMNKLDNSLFLVKPEGKFDSYSRSCPWNFRKQPVILTDKEKKDIDEKHPGSYDQAVKYGSDPKNQYWYICPRYWSLKDNVSLTEAEARSGKYGDIIPKDAKKVPPGGNVFEFTEDKYHKNDKGEYVKHYPGFLGTDAHPEGKCMPCCYSRWDSPQQKKRRDTCNQQMVEDPEKAKTKEEPKLSDTKLTDDYIMGHETFPLDSNRFGYLPLAIQKFIKTDNMDCQISVTNTKLKPDYKCLVRHGVETHKTQSFVACISDIIGRSNNKTPVRIPEMKKIFIKAMNLDIFMSLQNGNLIELFYKEGSSETGSDADINLEPYKETEIYKNVFKTKDEAKLNFLKKLCVAYENFKLYLKDDKVEINYTYLWDLICRPNSELFPKGINMAILEIKNDDVTNNVNILCPSNHYSSTLYDSHKKTIIIIKNGNYYEPIYEYTLHKKINGMFSVHDMNILENLKQVLLLIKKTITDKCAPRASLIKTKYEYKNNILLDRLVHLLTLKNYEVKQQVINYNGKVIGIVASKEGMTCMIPCYPSSPLIDLTAGYYWMDDDNYNNSYQNTKKFLTMVNNEFKNALNIIPCKPLFKIVEDGLIVGILTETNQFIKVSEPFEAEVEGDELETFGKMSTSGKLSTFGKIETNYKYLNEDNKKSLMSSKIDNERIKFIHEIKIESAFFNIFRNNVRIVLGEFDNKKNRNNIIQLITSQKNTYFEKMELVINILKSIMKNIVSFENYSDEDIKNLSTIKNCYMSDECSANPVCILHTDVTTENKICKLKIPQNNLINNQDNEIAYYTKIADELIRYKRIKSFFFQPNTFLSFTEVNYNLYDDEIILFQSLLTQEYFENLIPVPENPYINKNTYDTVMPKTTKWTQPYSDVVSFDTGVLSEECIKPIPKIFKDEQKIFKKNTLEEEFINNTNICSFNLLIRIISLHSNETKQYTTIELKEILIDEYLKLFKKYKMELLQIFKLEGKQMIHDELEKNISLLGKIIFNEDYYVTNIDIWILINHFSIPLVLISSKTLIENNNELFVMNAPTVSDASAGFYFLNVPVDREVDIVPINIAPTYKLLFTETREYKISLDKLTAPTQKKIQAGKKDNILENYLIKLKKSLGTAEVSLKPVATKIGKMTL
jgi:hypothetical protein